MPSGRVEDSSSMLRRDLPKGRNLRVCIVGAGVAGLRAADVLLQHGAHVTIYEARARVGGRLAQSNHLGHLVDLGPNWIHGSADINPMMDLARQTKTMVSSFGQREVLFEQDGPPISQEDAAEILEAFWGIVSDAYKHSNELFETIPCEESLMDFVRSKAAEMFKDESEEVAERKKRLLLKEAEGWGAFVGSPVSRQSLKFFWLEECIEGENPFVAGTYKKILDRLAELALGKADLKLQHRVTRIKSGGSSEAGVVVEIQNGLKEHFDEVIVTSPLGWLKRNKDVFQPELPPRLSKAIDSIGYGSLDKIYITFPSAFWQSSTPPNAAKISTTQQQNIPNITATTAPLHQPPTPPSTPKPYPGFTHWLAQPNGDDIQALNLAALPPPHAHPTLLFYIFSATATHIASLVSQHPPNSPSLSHALISFLHPYFSSLPNYRPEASECVPTGVLATAWAGDELAGYGSYCNFQVGLVEGDRDVECMRRGMPERGVWLAGEHTAPFVALGTVTGAYWAGEGVAGRIVEAYQDQGGR